MTTDLEPRSHDELDALLRRTLQNRAATVEHGATLVTSTRRRSRGPWLAGAAAVVAMLGLAGAVTVLRAGPDRGPAAGGDVTTACRGALPAGWRTALAATPTTIQGRPAYAQAITPDGRVIAQWIGSDKIDHVALMTASGSTELDRIPANRLYDRFDTDGTYAVLSTAPKIPANNPDSPTDDIVVVDLATGIRTHIFARAPIPRGWTVTTGAVVQGGAAFLAIAPAGHNPTSGRILRYDVASGTFTRSADVTGAYPEVEHDVRGVGWPGGSIPNPSAPSGLPPMFTRVGGDVRFTPVASDGHAAAWTDPADPFVVHWSDGRGATSSVTVRTHASPDPAFTPVVTGVSGRFVTLLTNDTGDPTVVLDAFTGAWAATANTAEQVFSAPGALVFGSAEQGVLRVATGALPEITCGQQR